MGFLGWRSFGLLLQQMWMPQEFACSASGKLQGKGCDSTGGGLARWKICFHHSSIISGRIQWRINRILRSFWISMSWIWSQTSVACKCHKHLDNSGLCLGLTSYFISMLLRLKAAWSLWTVDFSCWKCTCLKKIIRCLMSAWKRLSPLSLGKTVIIIALTLDSFLPYFRLLEHALSHSQSM